MSSILTAKISVRGVRPLLWHAFGPESIPDGSKRKEKTGAAGNDPEEWKRTVLLTEDKQLYLRPTYAFGCMSNGAVHTKKGRGSIQRLVQATLQVTDRRILVNRFLPDPLTTDEEQEVYLDIQGVKNPATKARNIRYRVAAKPGWELSFNVLWDKTIVSRGELEAVAIDAGRFVGLGDGRGIGNGRFEVTEFAVSEA